MKLWDQAASEYDAHQAQYERQNAVLQELAHKARLTNGGPGVLYGDHAGHRHPHFEDLLTFINVQDVLTYSVIGQTRLV